MKRLVNSDGHRYLEKPIQSFESLFAFAPSLPGLIVLLRFVNDSTVGLLLYCVVAIPMNTVHLTVVS